MPLNDVIKKIIIPGFDTSGLYLSDKDNIFDTDTIGKAELKKFDNQPIAIVVKFWHRSRTIKKTLRFHDISGLNAVKKAIKTRLELKEELEENGQIKKKNFKSLNELWAEYIELKRDSLSEKNVYSMLKTYDKWIRTSIGELAINKVYAPDIQAIINTILRQGKQPRTAQTIQQLLRPVYNYAIDLGIVTTNPATKISLPAFDNTMDFNLTDEKRKDLYNAIQNYEIDKYKGIMLFLYFGRRLNEALTLRWENIDFDQKTYYIIVQYSKNRKRQEYPLIEPLEAFLVDYGVRKHGFIFAGETTPHVTDDTFRGHWKKVLQLAGIDKKMRIHDTRHLLGNTMVNQGETLEALSKVFGHSSVAVPKRYAKTNLATADRVLGKYMDEK